MSFLQYLTDKRYFIAFYFIMMSFITLFMVVSNHQQNVLSNILYIHMSCLMMTSLYLLIGYFYRREMYVELSELTKCGQEEITALLPKAQNNEQKLFLQLLKKILEDHLNQLQKLNEEKRDQQEFIMSWIHEVKLPIAASRLLMENSEGKSVDMLVDKFEDELGKIDDYVEQALYYSRIDSFAKDYFITEIQINKIIKNSVKKYAKLFINKGIRFQMEDKDLFVQSDSKWLGFVIDQLIANSLKYTNTGGEVTIQFEEDQIEKRVLIQDTGIGIKQEDIHRVFEKGFTGSTGRSHVKSTGMGLYLAKQLANKLGHELTIQSEEGKFTTVSIHFPKIRNYYHV